MSHDVTQALTSAARVAGRAPSIHNTQPWRLRIDGSVLELFAEAGRQLTELDPDGHMMLISCGAALHHAQVALQAAGWRFDVERIAAEPLARIRVTGRQEPDPVATRRLAAMPQRHTDRRPVAAAPVPPAALAAVTDAMLRAGTRVHVLRREQVIDLAAAVDRALHFQRTDERQQTELAGWIGGDRDNGTGVPAAVIPGAPTPTTVPGRDFGTTGSLPPGSGHDENAVFAVLYGAGDTPRDWLTAGEALSAGWLDAVGTGLTLLPFSAPAEIASTRLRLQHLVSGVGFPYLVVRLGVALTDATPPATPRLPVESTTEMPGARGR
jgi:hypothetical protein